MAGVLITLLYVNMDCIYWFLRVPAELLVYSCWKSKVQQYLLLWRGYIWSIPWALPNYELHITDLVYIVH
jgi:hypothetical protein